MSANSPNNSTLTVSPYLHARKIRDTQLLPPKPSLQQAPFASFLNQSSPRQPTTNTNIPNLSILEQSGGPGRLLGGEEPLSQADRLRLWRHDSFSQHQYTTSIYIADKILCMTQDPNDAFWLSQIHYSIGNYQIARNVVKGYENSFGCKYMAGLSLYQMDKIDEAFDIIGEVNPFKKDIPVKNTDGGIKVEASLCLLRGHLFAKQNNFDKAKESYREAVLVDAKCYDAFDKLITNHLLTPEEEWDLLNNLNFDDADSNADLVKMLYITRLNKYSQVNVFEDAKQRLIDEYNLINNSDILLSQAELLFIQNKFHESLKLTEMIINKDELNIPAMSNYLSCLYEVDGKNKLFLIAHKLSENYPNHYITWLAIGIYYFAIKQNSEARVFFSKASAINPTFGPAWIGFAHSFAADGEHEQAISAYATASRLFPGIHLPNLFLGMQYLQMGNYTLANEYLNYSYSICSTDPLLLNELGVLHYHDMNFTKAELFFNRALSLTNDLDHGSKPWVSINCNLAHVYRKQRNYLKSIEHFNQVLKLAKRDSNIYSTLGLIYYKMGKYDESIDKLHMALTIQPHDSIANDLLEKSLEANMKLNTQRYINDLANNDDSSTPHSFPWLSKKSISGVSRGDDEVDDMIDEEDDDNMEIET